MMLQTVVNLLPPKRPRSHLVVRALISRQIPAPETKFERPASDIPTSRFEKAWWTSAVFLPSCTTWRNRKRERL